MEMLLHLVLRCYAGNNNNSNNERTPILKPLSCNLLGGALEAISPI